MKLFFLITFLLLTFTQIPESSGSEDRHIAKTDNDMPGGFNLEEMADKCFCNVSDADVCIITQTNEDCVKLGGQLVVDCRNFPSSGDGGYHSDGSCMPKEESLEPIYCYGF